jgi:putative hydrolase of the HAD superfamily
LTAPQGWPERVEAVLLDAGGVLLDLDYAYLRRLILARGIDVAEGPLSEAEAAARKEIDRAVRRGGDAWRDFFAILLHGVGVPMSEHQRIIDSLWEAHQRVGLWTVAVAGSLPAVRELRERGMRLGVVSNAEGNVARDLDRAGYGGMFETVVDSHLVGVSKPDPAIFRVATERMKLAPDRVVYLGDRPRIDVVGARDAGMSAVLLDRHDLYPEAGVPRIRSLGELLSLVGSASA